MEVGMEAPGHAQLISYTSHTGDPLDSTGWKSLDWMFLRCLLSLRIFESDTGHYHAQWLRKKQNN